MCVCRSLCVHPRDAATIKQHRTTNWELKMATVEQVYGKAAAMRLRTEKAVMEQFGVRCVCVAGAFQEWIGSYEC